jgi:hypothetical protein
LSADPKRTSSAGGGLYWARGTGETLPVASGPYLQKERSLG